MEFKYLYIRYNIVVQKRLRGIPFSVFVRMMRQLRAKRFYLIIFRLNSNVYIGTTVLIRFRKVFFLARYNL